MISEQHSRAQSGPVSAEGSSVELDGAVRKVMFHLLPTVIVIYTLGYLDRTNVGIAAIEMRAALQMSDAQYGLAAGIFTLGVLLFGIPSNLAMRRFGARRWLTSLLVIWGLITAATGLIQSAQQFIALRVLLGCAEAGLYPGLIYYISLWFPPAWRARMVVAMGFPFAIILGTPLSGGIIQYMDGVAGIDGWRMMFLVEGIGTALFGLVTIRLLISQPSHAPWLTAGEKHALSVQLGANDAGSEGRGVLADVVRNPKIWLFSLAYLCIQAAFIAVLAFVPQMIAAFGKALHKSFSLIEVSLLTAGPFVVASVAAWLWTAHSDRTGERARHGAAAAVVGSVGLALGVYAPSLLGLTAGLTIGVFGIWASLSLLWPMLMSATHRDNIPLAVAMMNTVGTISGVASPYLVGLLNDITGGYAAGFTVVTVVMAAGGVLMLVANTARLPGTALRVSNS